MPLGFVNFTVLKVQLPEITADVLGALIVVSREQFHLLKVQIRAHG